MYTTSVPVIAENKFKQEDLLRELRRCKAHRVAFALYRDLNHTFTAPETLKRTKELIDFFRKEGFETVIWIGETLGHDQSPLPAGKQGPYRHMKLPNKGTVASFCPTDENFTRDLCHWIGRVAALSPDLIMLDDDYRMNGGCVCDAHMEQINRELSEELSAEELYQKAFNGTQNKYRDAWMKVQGETLYSLARALRNAVDEANPAVRLGVCAAHYLWDADGADMETLVHILAGNTKPFLRTFGAPYHSYNSFNQTLSSSVELERAEFHWTKDWGIERISEGDSYPRPRFYCPAAYLECFDQILRADGRSDGILKYAVDYVSSPTYERGYIDAWEKNLHLYEEIRDLFGDKKATGVIPYLPPHLLREADLGTEAKDGSFVPLKNSSGNYNPAAFLTTENGLPSAFEGAGVRIVFGENARHLPLEELKEGCILDYPAAKILKQRGVDVGIEEDVSTEDLPVSHLGGAKQYFIEEQESVRISGAQPPVPVKCKKGAQILSEFIFGTVHLPAWIRYENAAGERFLLFTVHGKNLLGRGNICAGYLNGYSLRRMLLKQIAWLNRKPLDAYAEGNHPRLYTMVKKNESALAVGLWNLFEDKIHGLTVRINGDYRKIRFLNCTGKKEGDLVTLSGPLYPFEFAGIELFN